MKWLVFIALGILLFFVFFGDELEGVGAPPSTSATDLQGVESVPAPKPDISDE